jgi:hypothetical protein
MYALIFRSRILHVHVSYQYFKYTLIFIKANYICEELSLLANFAIYIISLKYLLLIDI